MMVGLSVRDAARLAATFPAGGAALLFGCGAAWADPIEGKWFTPMKETVQIAPCGADWCATVTTGTYAGASVGVFAGGGGSYTARITEPKNGRSARGSARISGEIMRIEGCLAKIACASRDWKRM